MTAPPRAVAAGLRAGDRPGWGIAAGVPGRRRRVLGLLGRTTDAPRGRVRRRVAGGRRHGRCGCWSGRQRPLSIDTGLMSGPCSLVSASRCSGIPLWHGGRASPVAHTAADASSSSRCCGRSCPDCGDAAATEASTRRGCWPAYLGVHRRRRPGQRRRRHRPGWRLPADPDAASTCSVWFGRNVCGILARHHGRAAAVLQHLAQPPPRRRLWDGSRLEFAAACLTQRRGCTSWCSLGDVHSCCSWSSAC